MKKSSQISEYLKDYGLLGIVITLILAGGGFAYQEWYDIPKLTYESLDSYPLGNDECIIPILIRNEGNDKATDIRITIYAGGEIQNVEEKSPENLRIEIDNNKLIVFLDRQVEKSQIALYLRVKTLSKNPINDISITSNQGMGKEYGLNESFINKIIIIPSILLGTISIMLVKSKMQRTVTNKDNKHSGKQNLILSYLCDIHDLKLEAEEYRKAKYQIEYWSEADRIGKLGLINPKSDVTEKWKNVLFDLIDYAGVTEDSIGIIYYNIARIENAQGNKDDADKHLLKAKKYSNGIIDMRVKIDPIM